MEWAKAEIEASRDSVLAEAASHIATAAETVFARDGGGAGNGGDGSLDRAVHLAAIVSIFSGCVLPFLGGSLACELLDCTGSRGRDLMC